MSQCTDLAANASAGIAPALRAVDCLAGEATASAFTRLFGSEGALAPALTLLLALYIGFFAVSLLTGRSRLSVSALTPRMLTLGLALTFATSWLAYQAVVWNLAVGAPDQIAGIVSGTGGSATQLFADRIDIVFAAISEAAQTGAAPVADAASAGPVAGQAAPQPAPQPAAQAQGSFSPGNLMWLGALLLLLGTVGVLVTARIVLAVLLALGPVFIIMALFAGTRGLTAGWLRAVVLAAIAPLFVVLAGSLMLELLVPVVAHLRSAEGGVDGRAAMALFMIAAVHVALMTMVMRMAGTIVAGWKVFGLSGEKGESGSSRGDPAPAAAAMTIAPLTDAAAAMPATQFSRQAALASAAAAASPEAGTASDAAQGSAASYRSRTVITHSASADSGLPPLPPVRGRASGLANGLGSRFRAASSQPRGIVR